MAEKKIEQEKKRDENDEVPEEYKSVWVSVESDGNSIHVKKVYNSGMEVALKFTVARGKKTLL